MYDDQSYLAHYGVLGMKWGIRKKVDSPGVKKAKENVKKTKKDFKIESRKVNLKSAFGVASKADLEKLESTVREHSYAKDDLRSTKILEKLNKIKKSEKQLTLEKEYQKKGMSPDEAAVAAYQNIRTKKILMGVAAVAVVAGGAYATYKYREHNIDKILKSGTMLQNVSSDGTLGVRDVFYTTDNGLDKIKYRGLYGYVLKLKEGNAYTKNIEILSDIKQASPKAAEKILGELYKSDPNFAKVLTNAVNNTFLEMSPIYMRKVKKARQSIGAGIIDKNVYEVFNASLVDHGLVQQTATDRYLQELARKGYNAIKDVNDSKYSGYGAINPIITFDTKGKIAVKSVQELVGPQLVKDAVKGNAMVFVPQLAGYGGVYAGYKAGIKKFDDVAQSKIRDNYVKDYRKKHPDTKMSNTEIYRMIERSKNK